MSYCQCDSTVCFFYIINAAINHVLKADLNINHYI